MKRCKKCGQPKPLAEFELKRARGVEYRRGTCHQCMLAYFSERNAKRRPKRPLPPPVASTPSGQRPWSVLMGEAYVPAEV